MIGEACARGSTPPPNRCEPRAAHNWARIPHGIQVGSADLDAARHGSL